jgi:alcohol dehydrogenase YqhD (iron-dependent ADH family)
MIATSKGTPDVPTQVFEQFITELETNKVSEEVVSRIRKTLLEQQKFTDSALKSAVLGDETPMP